MNEYFSNVDLIDSVRNEPIQTLSTQDATKLDIDAQEQKKKFFQETIHIQLKYGGDHQDNRKEKEWHIQRLRLTADFLQHLVDRLLETTNEAGALVAYLRETDTGEVIVPDNIQLSCRSDNPSHGSKKIVYELFVSQPNRTMDVLKTKNNCYRGEMKFLLQNVPIYSQNSIHQIKVDHIRNWIIDGILREDPAVQRTRQNIKKMEQSLESTIQRMGKIADEPMLNEKGYLLTGKKAEQKREEKSLLLHREKENLHHQLDDELEALLLKKTSIIERVSLSIHQHGDNTTWEFMFVGADREYFDDIIVNKNNWNTSFMYADSTLDVLNYDQSTLDNDYLVDTAGILVKRLEDGFGCFQKWNTECTRDMRDHNSHVDAYHGTHSDGNKNGYGLLYSSTGIYGGEMKNDQPGGLGELITFDGDFWSGPFDMNERSGRSRIGQRPNCYARSLPSGPHVIRFSDGSLYSGVVKNGEITGKGTYVTSQGDKLEGEFVSGSLVEGIQMKCHGDIIMEGKFKNGLLHGEGTIKCKSMRSVYKGYFVDGFKHGMGEEIISNKEGLVLSRYKGLFSNGKRSGLGRMEFNDVGFPGTSNSTEKARLKLDGYFFSGQPKAGGMIAKGVSSFAVPTTNKPSSKFRWLHRLKRVQDKKEDDLARSEIMIMRHDVSFRSMIETKKKELFEKYRQLVKSILSGNHEIQKGVSSKNNNNHKNILPSQAKYFKQRKVNKGPTTLHEGLNNWAPGLQMVDHTSDYNQSVLRNIMNQVRTKWSDMGIEELKNVEMSSIEKEYCKMEEEWSVIDVNKVHEIIHERKDWDEDAV